MRCQPKADPIESIDGEFGRPAVQPRSDRSGDPAPRVLNATRALVRGCRGLAAWLGSAWRPSLCQEPPPGPSGCETDCRHVTRSFCPGRPSHVRACVAAGPAVTVGDSQVRLWRDSGCATQRHRHIQGIYPPLRPSQAIRVAMNRVEQPNAERIRPRRKAIRQGNLHPQLTAAAP